ncbi:hypothetical protein LXL04_030894 [Taraxacum kok-saghyz]
MQLLFHRLPSILLHSEQIDFVHRRFPLSPPATSTKTRCAISNSCTGDFRYLHQRHSEQSPSLCQQLCIPTTTALIASSYALILSTHRRFEVFQIFR